MSLFAKFAKSVKKALCPECKDLDHMCYPKCPEQDQSVPKPGDKCGICKEDAGDSSFLIKVKTKQVIHCFECYEDVMDDVLFG